MTNIDYDSVTFKLTEETVLWFTQSAGVYWFLEVDPFLKTVRRTFNGEVQLVEIERIPETEVLSVKMHQKAGGVRGEKWRFIFNYRGNTYSQVL